MVESCWQVAAAVLFQLLHCSLCQTETVIVDSVEVKGANKSGLSSNSLLAFKTGTFLDNTEARVSVVTPNDLLSIAQFKSSHSGYSWRCDWLLGWSFLHGKHLPDNGLGQEMHQQEVGGGRVIFDRNFCY